MNSVNSFTINITRKSIKHLYLRVDEAGIVQVFAPKNVKHTDILAFIDQKQAWIHRKKLCLKEPEQLKTLPLLGKHYPINRQQGKYNKICFKNHECQILINPKKPRMEQVLITEFYRSHLYPLLEKWVNFYQPILSVSPAEIRTKNMKTRWGTCNPRAKRLWFNVQLTRFSEKCIEYVVVHEMTHLREPKHNKYFYALVEKAMPDWKKYHNILKHSS